MAEHSAFLEGLLRLGVYDTQGTVITQGNAQVIIGRHVDSELVKVPTETFKLQTH